MKTSSTFTSNQCFCLNISEMNRIESTSYYCYSWNFTLIEVVIPVIVGLGIILLNTSMVLLMKETLYI